MFKTSETLIKAKQLSPSQAKVFYQHKSLHHDNKIFIIGGFEKDEGTFHSITVYDIIENNWY